MPNDIGETCRIMLRRPGHLREGQFKDDLNIGASDHINSFTEGHALYNSQLAVPCQKLVQLPLLDLHLPVNRVIISFHGSSLKSLVYRDSV